MTETFWLFSLPLKHRDLAHQKADVISQDRQIIFTYLKEKLVTAGDVCSLYPIELPEFKTGTLDSLVTINDQLAKLDPQVESMATRLTASWKSLLEGHPGNDSSLLVGEKSPPSYIRSFTWNRMKYRVDEPISTIIDTLMTEVHQIDNVVKNKLSTFNHTKSNLSHMNRKNTGSLLTRNLNGLIKAEDVIQNSDYMQTMFFVINKNDQDTWLNVYESLIPLGAVPRSARIVVQEDEYILYGVVVMKKYAEEYVKAATARKFTPRTDFQFNPELLAQNAESSSKLEGEVQAQWTNLVRLIKTNFGELFAAWMHLKMIRVHVESILHYGLPPTFLTVVLQPTKSDEKVRKIFLHVLEKLDLPGISQLELTAAALEAGIKTAKNDPLAARLSAIDAAEEAELWSQLNASEGGKQNNSDPFVNFIFKW